MAGSYRVRNLRDSPEINALKQCGAANAVDSSILYMKKLIHSDPSAHSKSESALSASTYDSESSEEESRRSQREKPRQKEKTYKAVNKGYRKKQSTRARKIASSSTAALNTPTTRQRSVFPIKSTKDSSQGTHARRWYSATRHRAIFPHQWEELISTI